MTTERPILMSGPMVVATLTDLKTQTRRVLTKQPLDVLPMKVPNEWVALMTRDPEPHGLVFKCRHGVPGDHLWVRETHWRLGRYVKNGITESGKQKWRFRAKRDSLDSVRFDTPKSKPKSREELGWHKRPSIFIPRWASRITLEIVNVRVERVQSISKKDCIAEGIAGLKDIHAGWHQPFAELWDSINLKRGFGWDANPWVWVIEFKRIKP